MAYPTLLDCSSSPGSRWCRIMSILNLIESYDVGSYMRKTYYDTPVNLNLGFEFNIPVWPSD